MNSTDREPLSLSRWLLHCWAQLTVVATFVLLLLGSVVTTFRVGMADPVWPTYPWHMLLISWEEPSPGFIIEHSHRLAGYVVGCCVIVLALGLCLLDPRRWARWLGVLALVGVIVQGLLGGFRVILHEILGSSLALFHGCFAQVVFALLVSLSLVTSPRWLAAASRLSGAEPDVRISRIRLSEQRHSNAQKAGRLQRWALGTVVLIFVQIILGAMLRHTGSGLGQRGHLLLAFAVAIAVAWLWKLVLQGPDKTLLVPVAVLAAAVAVQVVLGVEAWVQRFAGELPAEYQQLTVGQAALRTAHVLLGYVVLAASVTVAWRSHRQLAQCRQLAPRVEEHLTGKLEGAL